MVIVVAGLEAVWDYLPRVIDVLPDTVAATRPVDAHTRPPEELSLPLRAPWSVVKEVIRKWEAGVITERERGHAMKMNGCGCYAGIEPREFPRLGTLNPKLLEAIRPAGSSSTPARRDPKPCAATGLPIPRRPLESKIFFFWGGGGGAGSG